MIRKWLALAAVVGAVLLLGWLAFTFLTDVEMDLVALGVLLAVLAFSFVWPRRGTASRWVLAPALCLAAMQTVQDLAFRRHWPLAEILTIKHWLMLPFLVLLVVAAASLYRGRGRAKAARNSPEASADA